MVRKSTDGATSAGTLIRTARGDFFAQFSIGAGKRKGTLLRTCKTEDEAIARKAAIARLAALLREAGHLAMIPKVISDAGALDDDGMRKLTKLVARIVAGKEPGLVGRATARREGMTVAELAKDWTTGELARQHPDHVRVKKTSDDDRRIFEWLNKVRMPDGRTFGERAVASLTLDDCDHVMGGLPKTSEAPATRRNYAQALRRLLVYAVYPLRLLPALPIPKGWLPKGGGDKAKAWIYPSEDRALMQCGKVPLAHRVLFGLLVREGLRVSEALALTWADLDLERGVVRLDTNKTDDPRSWVLGEDVARALDAWRGLRGRKAEKATAAVFPRDLGKHATLARELREGLKLAGVTRPELLVPKAGRLLLRAHDLRGSFVTLALAAGRTEAWVTDRTGHKSSAMIYTYKRASRTAAELELGWLAPLDEAIPELAPKPSQGANGVQTGGPSGSQRSSGRSKTSGKAAPRALSGHRASLLKTADGASCPGVRISPPPPRKQADPHGLAGADPENRSAPFAPPFAPPLDEVELEAAIARLTRALATADDDAIPELVAERADMRRELAALREDAAGVARLDDERARRGPRR